MFSDLKPLPGDPILALMAAYREDPSSNKADLGVGVYQDENGDTPILASVRSAEQRLHDSQTTKAYVGIAGSAQFNQAMSELIFGADHAALKEQRLVTMQSTGGSGGLRVAGEFLNSVRSDASVWLTTPTWPNHVPLLSSAGLQTKQIPYYDAQSSKIDAQAMFDAIARIPSGDILLLHGCCHNPTGADLNEAQWRRIADICCERGILPFIDTAYQGFAQSLDQDAAGVRILAEQVPEMLVVSSCSKNFGLYRERVGAISLLAKSKQEADVSRTHLMKIVRAMISMPPDHGAAIVATILQDDELRAQWHGELTQMRERMADQRRAFVQELAKFDLQKRFAFIAEQYGMFSLLGISSEQIQRLQEEFHVYIVGSGRINVAGLTAAKRPAIVAAIADVLAD